MVHTDDKAVAPVIRAASNAGVPLIHVNRPPAVSDGNSVALVADNRKLMENTVIALVEIARSRGGRYDVAILLGDLGDANGVHRREGFNAAVARYPDLVDVAARIGTERNADKAYAGLSNALQAHPDINFLVTSSDFLTPQIEQALRIAGKWHPEHVLIAGFDGDENGYAQLAARYWHVDEVQNLDYEVELRLKALDRIREGAWPAKVLVDPATMHGVAVAVGLGLPDVSDLRRFWSERRVPCDCRRRARRYERVWGTGGSMSAPLVGAILTHDGRQRPRHDQCESLCLSRDYRHGDLIAALSDSVRSRARARLGRRPVPPQQESPR